MPQNKPAFLRTYPLPRQQRRPGTAPETSRAIVPLLVGQKKPRRRCRHVAPHPEATAASYQVKGRVGAATVRGQKNKVPPMVVQRGHPPPAGTALWRGGVNSGGAPASWYGRVSLLLQTEDDAHGPG